MTIIVVSAALALLILHGEAVAADTRTPWDAPLEAMDRALKARDVSAAEMAWRNAYGAAIRARGWEGLLAVGDASVRIGDVASRKGRYTGRAREAYLSALFRARDRRSLDGVLRVAEAFAALGDMDVVQHALRIADGLASRDKTGEAGSRILAARQRLVPGATPRISGSALPAPVLDSQVGP